MNEGHDKGLAYLAGADEDAAHDPVHEHRIA
jgi:hypothetical protein